MSRWFAMSNRASVGEISIFDEIGTGGITAKDFHEDLKALGNVSHIALSINSPGGEVFAGISIFNMLRRHKASVTVTVDGVAASIASAIAMAGDTIIMPENGMMMIHDPSGLVVGTSKDMRDLAAALDKMRDSLAGIYASKTGLPRDKIADLMDAETWLTANEAVELGFADSIEEPVKIAARFDLERRFGKAPKQLSDLNATAIYRRFNQGRGKPVTAMATPEPPPPSNFLPAEVTARIWDRFNRIRV